MTRSTAELNLGASLKNLREVARRFASVPWNEIEPGIRTLEDALAIYHDNRQSLMEVKQREAQQ